MLLALLLHHIHTTQETATPRNLLIVDIRINGEYRRVGIVGMQNHELLMFLGYYI